MDKSKILLPAKAELTRHTWDTFVDDPPSMTQGGKGVVVPGFPRCKKPLNTMNQFMERLANDVLPPIVELVLTLDKG